jgi:DNA-directed RNA polymerase subunit RPC12/RpoP
MGRARSLSEFQKAFLDEASCAALDEASCAAFFFERRWPDGFICPGCGKRRAAVLKSRPRLYECLDCGRQTSITAGTANCQHCRARRMHPLHGREFPPDRLRRPPRIEAAKKRLHHNVLAIALANIARGRALFNKLDGD